MKWLVLLALLGAGPAKKARKPADTAAADAVIKKALDAEGQHVADCVTTGAPQGTWSLTVKVKISVNAAGQVMNADVQLEPARADHTRECIEKALRAASWPKSSSALTTISREWSFSMK